MKPLTRYAALVYFDHFNDDRQVYLTDEADAVIAELEAELAALLRGRVNTRIPTDTMEQEFAMHYRRGKEAGRKELEAEVARLRSQLEGTCQALALRNQEATDYHEKWVRALERIDELENGESDE